MATPSMIEYSVSDEQVNVLWTAVDAALDAVMRRQPLNVLRWIENATSYSDAVNDAAGRELRREQSDA